MSSSDLKYLNAKKSDLERALLKFKSLVKENPTEVETDAAIQRFEFTFELAWKVLKVVLEYEGAGFFRTPREVLKNAFTAGYVESAETWEDMLRARNLTVHAYNQELANEVYAAFPDYVMAFDRLLKNLNKTYS